MARSSRESARSLAELANEQGGYFTPKQARNVGYGYQHLDYHETAGNFERVGHGLYRIPTIPFGEHDELIRLTLWSRNQKDVPQAVVSHQTALVLHELTELLPSETHMTVPPTFRKPVPRGCVLHKGELSKGDIEERSGFRVTTPLRTLLDVSDGSVSLEQLKVAFGEALARGLVRRKALDAVLKQSPLGKPLTAILGRKSARR